MLNGHKIFKNLNKIKKLRKEKGTNAVFKKAIHLSKKKWGPSPARKTLAKKDLIFKDLDKDMLRQDLEHILTFGLFRSTYEIEKNIQCITDESANFLIEDAEKTLENRFFIYGNLEVRYEPDHFSWLHDPLTNFTWPRSWIDIYERKPKPIGTDIKTVWEIARFHFLSTLAYAYMLTGKEKYVRFAVNKVDSWIDENPFLHRPHWLMPMECSLRIINWCVYLPLLNIKNYTDLAFRNKLSQSILKHLIYIRYNLECSPSQAGNHYLADLVGLIATRLLFPSFEWAIEFTKHAMEEFQNEVDRQFKESGIYFQGSLPYHRLGSEILLIGVALAKKIGMTFRKETIDRINQTASFTKFYADAAENSPIIGDNDSGIFLRYFPGQESTNHRYLNCLFEAIIKNRGLPKNSNDFLCCLHFVESDFVKRTEGHRPLKIGESQLIVKEFDGLIIVRNDSDHLYFNTLKSSQGHSHNDKLSIYPAFDGNLLFLDRGSYSYTGSWQKRHEDRISSSHNAPIVNNWEQNKIWKDDLYYNNGDAKSFSSIEQNAGNLQITGWHLGYNRFRKGLKVFRKLLWNFHERHISITDWIEGIVSDEIFLFQLNYLINPTWSIKPTDCGFIFTYQEKRIIFKDADDIGFELAQSCFCPSYQMERECEVLKASTKIKVGDKIRVCLKY